MNSIEEYLLRTKSAVQKLYQAIDSYNELLEYPTRPAFIYFGEKNQEEYLKWYKENKHIIEERVKRDNEYVMEILAIATLSGAILQFAYMAIETYSKNIKSHQKYLDILPHNHKTTKFCIGREIDEIPIGLIIYAGRHQAHHYNDKEYNRVTERVFHDLSNWYSPTFNKHYTNEYFDLSNWRVKNYASNILWKLGWINYEFYEHDLISLLK